MEITKLLEHLYEAAYIVDENRKILFWNKKAESITGYTKEEIIGKYCFDNILRHVTDSGQHLCHDGCPLFDSIKNNKINEAKVYLHHKKGYRVPVTVKTIPFYDEVDKKRKAIEVFTDIKNDKDLYVENKLLKQEVITDALTQVNNRYFIDYQLETCMREFDSFKTPFGVLFIDIDFFKKVNDQYGHAIGDLVLKAVSKTINLNIRYNDFVGRYGGEEFVVILRNITKEDLYNIAEKLRILIQEIEVNIEDISISVTVSIGCSHYIKPLTKEELIKDADKKMYQAKQSGRNKVII
ncbi:diguanylate cyclase [Candidatus Izemoplasma sp. B36]|uniref:diguanylate cyclase n=1 Tax=Candidatus Izemoplasma sp. B36 TaxID=3242468 RepID=UPI003555DAF5